MAADLTQTAALRIAPLLAPGEQLLHVTRIKVGGDQYRDGAGRRIRPEQIWGPRPRPRPFRRLGRVLFGLISFLPALAASLFDAIITDGKGRLLDDAGLAPDPKAAVTGAPGSAAASLPADLHPDWRPKGTYPVLAATSQRLLIFRVDERQGSTHQLLWQLPRNGLRRVSASGNVFLFQFPDGSSARIATPIGRATPLYTALGVSG